MILYPTETLYAIGVNALDGIELSRLFELKGRDEDKAASWLVRSVKDIARYAAFSDTARLLATQFLPGPLTLVLPVLEHIPDELVAADRTIGFRVSSDPMAAAIIEAFMSEYDAPLTCTGANVSGAPTLPTVSEILQQFGAKAAMIDEVHDDGPRKGLASTVVRVIGDDVTILREGSIAEYDIRKVIG